MGPELLKLRPELQVRVQAELNPGEVVNWAGQPLPQRYAAAGGWTWAFFIPWTAFAVIWVGTAAQFRLPSFAQPQDFFAPIGLPFVAIGIFGLGAPLWLRLAAAHVVYVVTNQRAFSIEGRRTLTVRSYPLTQLSAMSRRERADGSGDLILRVETYTGKGGTRTRERGFFGLAEVKRIGKLLEDLALRQQSKA